jgi:signal peptidase I
MKNTKLTKEAEMTVKDRDIPDFLELSKEILKRRGCLCFRARGGSMYPFIRDGEVIIVKPAMISEVRIGDIIFYCTSQAKMVVHRVIKTCKENGEMVLMTKGDFTPCFDQLVHSNNLLGKVVAIERKGKIIRLDKGRAMLTSVFLAKISPFTLWAYPILRKAKQGVCWILSGIVWKLQGLKIYRSLIKKFVRGEIL